jgi:mannose-6-phosphate isomerase
MAALYPLVFEPRLKERICGGRALATFYRKNLPPDRAIGESWEVADRPGDESVIVNGPWAGQTLRWAMEQERGRLLGDSAPADDGRFPLLCKILDARETLSLQVHPPARLRRLGEPKTEMWYIAHAEPGAELHVGLKQGVTRAEFERRLQDGTVADCFHRIRVSAGDAMFLPSGRVHAIGRGLVIFEIQQNSDTTFRVFDWNRRDRDGNFRELHVEQSLASIDFADVEPALVATAASHADGRALQPLVRDPLFDVDCVRVNETGNWRLEMPGRARVLAVTAGVVRVSGGGIAPELSAGQFCLVPGGLADAEISAAAGAGYLLASAGSAPA